MRTHLSSPRRRALCGFAPQNPHSNHHHSLRLRLAYINQPGHRHKLRKPRSSTAKWRVPRSRVPKRPAKVKSSHIQSSPVLYYFLPPSPAGVHAYTYTYRRGDNGDHTRTRTHTYMYVVLISISLLTPSFPPHATGRYVRPIPAASSPAKLFFQTYGCGGTA